MSSPIFFQRYKDGNLASFERSSLIRILGSAAVMNGENLVAIQFSDMDRGEVYGADAAQFEQLSVDEGVGDQFFDALWRIADASGALIYWLGDVDCSAVTNQAVLKNLPEDIVADIGPVKIVANGHDLQKAVFDIDDFEGD